MTAKRSETNTSTFCQFPFADGRLCRMLRAPGHASLCLFHARDEQQLRDAQAFGAQLAASFTGNFLTASDINHVLGKVFTALAQKRISQRNAATLAYIGQLLLHSIPTVSRETKFVYSFERWQEMIDNAIHLPNSWPTLPAYHRARLHHKRSMTPSRPLLPFLCRGAFTSPSFSKICKERATSQELENTWTREATIQPRRR